MPWMRCDAMVKGWLTTAMQKEIRNSVKYAATATEIWADLLERFGKASAPRAYELKQTLSVTQQGDTSVSAYYTKLRGIWDEMQSALSIPRCTCGGCECDMAKKIIEVRKKERLYEFLMGLNSDFSVIRTQILATNPTPSLANAYHLVSEDERQRAIAADRRPMADSMTFKAFAPGRRETYNGSRRDKPEKTSYKETKNTDVTPHCTECGKDGHNRDGCFKLIGYPDWWPGKIKREESKPKAACIEISTSPIPGLTNEQYESFCKHFSETGKISKEGTTPMAFMAGKTDYGNDWIEHITFDPDVLENMVETHNDTPVLMLILSTQNPI
ncbi:GAG-pre-integrase domain, Gag-polypeptide of LTR copia-type [Artemisia annua]|uniref:GAG-pre-integrase domain, Gag-polypeptide of LTR copia-type n=1 Tax=Artemisia annua TaxID=35608 RepID=A0A2U1LIR9_ARTAN|nr:GAG-pre-integrase domain, Gag-polypeptide of LTR copia-type [Artemisia annua]